MTVRFTRGAALALTLGAALAFTGCAAAAPESATVDQELITVTDNHGEVQVPVNPQTVVALDNTSFETLSEWGIELAAVPKDIMGVTWPEYTDDKDVANVGSHREPNLEVIVAAQPDLIIGGKRFADEYADIKKQNPQAAVIEIAPREDEDQFEELKRQTEILGQIFEREADATALNEELDAAIAGAKEAYNGTDTVMAVNTSAGQIGYLAPGVGRALGPVFTKLGWKPALEVENSSNNHQGDEISLEAIAQSNPEWLIVLDRDAALLPESRDAGSLPAEEMIRNAEALKNVPAVQKDQIVFLAPNFYFTEGIQAYTELFNQIEGAFSAE